MGGRRSRKRRVLGFSRWHYPFQLLSAGSFILFSCSTHFFFSCVNIPFLSQFSLIKIMSSDSFDRVSYLSQISNILAMSGNTAEKKLSTFYGHTSREICLKHQILTLGFDSIKRKRCKKCFIHLVPESTCSVKTKDKLFIVKCRQCGTVKRIPVQKEHKTRFEKLILYKQQEKSKSDPVETSTSKNQ